MVAAANLTAAPPWRTKLARYSLSTTVAHALGSHRAGDSNIPAEGDSPVAALLASLGDRRDDAARGPGPGAGREAHHEAISGGRDAAAIQQVDVAGELLSGVLAGLARQKRQQFVDLRQAFNRAALQCARAMPLHEDAIRTEERLQKRLRPEARRPLLQAAQVVDDDGRP